MTETPANRRYIACSYSQGSDVRSYTFHYDGDEQFEQGDAVLISNRKGDGQKRVYVQHFQETQPPFETKPIFGRAPTEDGDEAKNEKEESL